VKKPIKKKGHEKLMRGRTPKAAAPAAKKTAAAEREAAEKRAAKKEPKRHRQTSLPGMELPHDERVSLQGLKVENLKLEVDAKRKEYEKERHTLGGYCEDAGFKPGQIYYDDERGLEIEVPKPKQKDVVTRFITPEERAARAQKKSRDSKPIGEGVMTPPKPGYGEEPGRTVTVARSGGEEENPVENIDREEESGETAELVDATH